jgi:hypothetical protein
MVVIILFCPGAASVNSACKSNVDLDLNEAYYRGPQTLTLKTRSLSYQARKSGGDRPLNAEKPFRLFAHGRQAALRLS